METGGDAKQEKKKQGAHKLDGISLENHFVGTGTSGCATSRPKAGSHQYSEKRKGGQEMPGWRCGTPARFRRLRLATIP